jgi:hypothetical protein
VLALFAKKAAFLRTPRTGERTTWLHALRANWAETTLALFGLAGIAGALTKANELSGPLLAALLLFPTLGLAAAPCNSWAARRAALPSWLRDRRRTEYRRDRRAFAAGMATGGAVAVAGVAVLAIALMFTGNRHPVQGPSLVGPAQGAPATPTPTPTTTTPTPTPTPTPTTTTPTPTPTTTTPTPTQSPSPTSTSPTATPTPSPSSSATSTSPTP